jgi:hypothetical protein
VQRCGMRAWSEWLGWWLAGWLDGLAGTWIAGWQLGGAA